MQWQLAPFLLPCQKLCLVWTGNSLLRWCFIRDLLPLILGVRKLRCLTRWIGFLSYSWRAWPIRGCGCKALQKDLICDAWCPLLRLSFDYCDSIRHKLKSQGMSMVAGVQLPKGRVFRYAGPQHARQTRRMSCRAQAIKVSLDIAKRSYIVSWSTPSVIYAMESRPCQEYGVPCHLKIVIDIFRLKAYCWCGVHIDLGLVQLSSVTRLAHNWLMCFSLRGNVLASPLEAVMGQRCEFKNSRSQYEITKLSRINQHH